MQQNEHFPFSSAIFCSLTLENSNYTSILSCLPRFITVYQAHFVFLVQRIIDYFSRSKTRKKNSFNLNVKQNFPSIDLESSLASILLNIPFSRERERERKKKREVSRTYHRWKFESIDRSIGSLNEEESAVREKSGSRGLLATRDFTLRGSINYSLGRRRQGRGASEKRKHGGIV